MWICCQLGSREQYAVPRALSRIGESVWLFTDTWVAEKSLLRLIPNQRLRGRYHDDLRLAVCHHFSFESMVRDSWNRLIGAKETWAETINRNEWFQSRVIGCLQNLDFPVDTTVFAYSYAARSVFEHAKKRRWRTILGQIDAGHHDESVVLEGHRRHSGIRSRWSPAPSGYWTSWRQECELADLIVVNSDWSAEALSHEGVSPGKVRIVPLAYEGGQSCVEFTRTYPESFSNERPLKILFLGQVAIRKGIAELLEVADLLRGKPVRLIVVGPLVIDVPPEYATHPVIQWVGSIPHSECEKWYRAADVFIFPTLSDGFGITQLEAQAWKLPIIASRHCGRVVQHNVNGRILNSVGGREIAETIEWMIENPGVLVGFSENASLSSFTLGKLATALREL